MISLRVGSRVPARIYFLNFTFHGIHLRGYIEVSLDEGYE